MRLQVRILSITPCKVIYLLYRQTPSLFLSFVAIHGNSSSTTLVDFDIADIKRPGDHYLRQTADAQQPSEIQVSQYTSWSCKGGRFVFFVVWAWAKGVVTRRSRERMGREDCPGDLSQVVFIVKF
jgi:hypothetical protein